MDLGQLKDGTLFRFHNENNIYEKTGTRYDKSGVVIVYEYFDGHYIKVNEYPTSKFNTTAVVPVELTFKDKS